MEKFLNELNSAQKEATVNYKGPSLIIAGAGSGKTRVLTYRIAYLLKQGVQPENILALTFTNKAANEMKERIAQIVGEKSARKLWMGTFHSVFSKILRMESKSIGYSSNFTIYDTVDSRALIKNIIKELNLDDKKYKPQAVQFRISKAKNNLITWQTYNKNTKILKQDEKEQKEKICDIYRLYATRCKKSDAMDFDDLLLNINILFRDHPEILEKYQNRFHYILVDEYQDTNFAQYLIVKKLSQQKQNICVVGDDAQSIYSFRGAKIENILNFQKDYPQYKLFKLEQNYRSTQTIVNAANSMIKKNENQIHKKVFSSKEEGEKIEILESYTDTEEAINIAQSVSDKVGNNGYKYEDFAILYRTNAQSRNFEEAFRRFNIPYKIYGGISFYQRKEIKDLMAYLRLCINKQDEEALFRIINFPARGIGKTSQDRIRAYANSEGVSSWEILKDPGKYPVNLTSGAINKIKHFVQQINHFTEIAENNDAYDAAITVASKSGMLEEYENPTTIEDQTKYQNLQEILNGIKDFTTNYEGEGTPTLIEYLEDISLMTNIDKEDQEDSDKVTLMTMHSAKGLEFKEVFLAGIEEGLFPSQMSMNTEKDVEEERRLFYVALTRAEEKATISYAKNRYKYGSSYPARPSRFIYDIDPNYMVFPEYNSIEEQEEEKSFTANNFSTQEKQNFISTHGSRKLKKVRSSANKEHTRSNPESEYDGEFKEGMTIEHDRFGKGKILSLENAMPHTKAKIQFEKYGDKQLLLKYAKLKIISD
ncbi:MAG: ATP-dependent helicase [Bacteroidales bacterium]